MSTVAEKALLRELEVERALFREEVERMTVSLKACSDALGRQILATQDLRTALRELRQEGTVKRVRQEGIPHGMEQP